MREGRIYSGHSHCNINVWCIQGLLELLPKYIPAAEMELGLFAFQIANVVIGNGQEAAVSLARDAEHKCNLSRASGLQSTRPIVILASPIAQLILWP